MRSLTQVLIESNRFMAQRMMARKFQRRSWWQRLMRRINPPLPDQMQSAMLQVVKRYTREQQLRIVLKRKDAALDEMIRSGCGAVWL